MTKSENNIYFLPPDLFSRNYFIADGIRHLKKEKGLGRINILDVGGRGGLLSKFLDKEDNLTLLDTRSGAEKNLVIGDATNMLMFENEEFDVAVSGDVFEHIPSQKRERFIAESLRVSKYLLILATPLADHSVSVVEKNINDYYKYLHKKDHPWLKEHITNKLPTRMEVDNIFKKFKLPYSVVYSNNIDNWIVLQNFIFYTSKFEGDVDLTKEIYSFYNKNLKTIEDPSVGYYRTIFFVNKDKNNGYKYNYQLEPNIKFEFNKRIMQAISDRTKSLLNETKEQEIIIKSLENIISELSGKILSIENSRTWKLRNKLLRFLGRDKT
jgi:predicted SAM-dependent methyltransferase